MINIVRFCMKSLDIIQECRWSGTMDFTHVKVRIAGRELTVNSSLQYRARTLCELLIYSQVLFAWSVSICIRTSFESN